MNESKKTRKDKLISEILELVQGMTDKQLKEFVNQLETRALKND